MRVNEFTYTYYYKNDTLHYTCIESGTSNSCPRPKTISGRESDWIYLGTEDFLRHKENLLKY